MVGVEDLAGPAEVEPVAAGLFPGEDGEPVEVGPDDRVLGGAGVHPGQAVHLALGLGEDVGGGLGLFELLPEFIELGVVRLGLAQLVLDRLDLLAEEVVALGLGDLRPHLRLDLGGQFEDGQLPGQEPAELLKPGPDVGLGEELLLLLDRERQAGTEEVGQAARLAGVHRRDLQLLGDLLALLDHPLEEAVDVVDLGVELHPFFNHIFERFDPADQVGFGLDDLDQAGAEHPLRDDPGRAVGELEHLQDVADAEGRVEVADRRLIGLRVALGDQAEGLFLGHDVVDQLDPGGPVDHQRDDGLREDDVGAEREQGDAVGQLARDGAFDLDQDPPGRRLLTNDVARLGPLHGGFHRGGARTA